ncbi:unnamed protein product [Amoebophrya sp. A120]|nr:unnamed protein product [Amoebophrya sp. A120]|eukprot:GSA120T00013841001.1
MFFCCFTSGTKTLSSSTTTFHSFRISAQQKMSLRRVVSDKSGVLFLAISLHPVAITPFVSALSFSTVRNRNSGKITSRKKLKRGKIVARQQKQLQQDQERREVEHEVELLPEQDNMSKEMLMVHYYNDTNDGAAGSAAAAPGGIVPMTSAALLQVTAKEALKPPNWNAWPHCPRCQAYNFVRLVHPTDGTGTTWYDNHIETADVQVWQDRSWNPKAGGAGATAACPNYSNKNPSPFSHHACALEQAEQVKDHCNQSGCSGSIRGDDQVTGWDENAGPEGWTAHTGNTWDKIKTKVGTRNVRKEKVVAVHCSTRPCLVHGKANGLEEGDKQLCVDNECCLWGDMCTSHLFGACINRERYCRAGPYLDNVNQCGGSPCGQGKNYPSHRVTVDSLDLDTSINRVDFTTTTTAPPTTKPPTTTSKAPGPAGTTTSKAPSNVGDGVTDAPEATSGPGGTTVTTAPATVTTISPPSGATTTSPTPPASCKNATAANTTGLPTLTTDELKAIVDSAGSGDGDITNAVLPELVNRCVDPETAKAAAAKIEVVFIAKGNVVEAIEEAVELVEQETIESVESPPSTDCCNCCCAIVTVVVLLLLTGGGLLAYFFLFTESAEKQGANKGLEADSYEPRFSFDVVQQAFIGAGLSPAYAKVLAQQIANTDSVEDDDELSRPQTEHDAQIMKRLGLDFFDTEPERVGRLRYFLEAVARGEHEKHKQARLLSGAAGASEYQYGGGFGEPEEEHVLTEAEARLKLEAAGLSTQAAFFVAARLHAKMQQEHPKDTKAAAKEVIDGITQDGDWLAFASPDDMAQLNTLTDGNAQFYNNFQKANTKKKKTSRHSTMVLDLHAVSVTDQDPANALQFGHTETAGVVTGFQALMPPKKRYDLKLHRETQAKKKSRITTGTTVSDTTSGTTSEGVVPGDEDHARKKKKKKVNKAGANINNNITDPVQELVEPVQRTSKLRASSRVIQEHGAAGAHHTTTSNSEGITSTSDASASDTSGGEEAHGKGPQKKKKKKVVAGTSTKQAKQGEADASMEAAEKELLSEAKRALADVGFSKQQATLLANRIAGVRAAELRSQNMKLTDEEKAIAQRGLNGAKILDLSDLVDELVAQKASFFVKTLAPTSTMQSMRVSARPVSMLAERCMTGQPLSMLASRMEGGGDHAGGHKKHKVKTKH